MCCFAIEGDHILYFPLFWSCIEGVFFKGDLGRTSYCLSYYIVNFCDWSDLC